MEPASATLLLALFVLLQLLGVLEGRRPQAVPGKVTGRRATRVGVRELQHHPQPDRKVIGA